jgi:hypothetical protein
MIEKLTEIFKFERLLQDAEKITIPDEERYLSAYLEFIQYFKSIDKLTQHHTVIGISFTYSWMPTILDFRSDKIEEATKILNKAKQGIRPSTTELDVLKSCFNNSLVGSSKLLHFINPETFAIWDSRVYRYLFKQEPHSYRVDNNSTYLEYLSFCDFITNNISINKLQQIIEQKVGYKLTKMRAVELIFFYNGAKFK